MMSYHVWLAIDHMKELQLLWLQLLRPMVSKCVELRQKQAVVLCCVNSLSQNQIAQKSKVKRYLTTTVYVLICSDAFWIEGCFLGYFFFFSKATAVWMGVSRRHLYSSGGFSLLDFRMPYILRIYTAESNSEQTNTPIVYTNIIPTMQCLPPSARWTVRGVTAGYKNAYSSLWLVHKLAAGRLGLGLGRGPGPELAQLLAAMLSLPQPQPHCAKPLHTYNLLIMHEVFKGVKKVYCRTKESVEN